MSVRGVVVGSVLSSLWSPARAVRATASLPSPFGRFRWVKTGNVFSEPYVTFKKGETGHLVQSIHGLPELRHQGWAELEMTVGVTADGQEATYVATTRVGLSEKESLQEAHSATVRLSN